MSRVDNVDFITKDDKEVFPDYLKTICDETYRCKAIISKLLDFSRRQVPVFGKVDINDLITDVLKMIKQQKELGKLSIELDLNPENIIVYGDSNQLKQVILNMIMNAIDATEDVGKTRISTSLNDDCAQMIFEDTGCGIAPENLDKILEPFFSTKPPGKGTGLGLSICYGIIEEHKGKISISSNGVGEGATFMISLPIFNETENG
jgi:signal transduction histidine kinase